MARDSVTRGGGGGSSSGIQTGTTPYSGQGTYNKPATPNGYAFNLPPHVWSLPTRPVVIDTVNGERNQIIKPAPIDERVRRGRLWRWDSPSVLVQNTGIYKEEKTVYQSQVGRGASVIPRKQQTVTVNKKVDNRFGFQFIWNPQQINISTSMTFENTPNAADKFLTALGVAPGTGVVGFTIVIDRVNDFACFKGSTTANNSDLTKYYPNWYGTEGPGRSSKADLISELRQKGTIADIEYIYKTINGDGLFNIAGNRSSDTGILLATAVRLDVGPLSYIGFVNSLTVNHVYFTEDMIPLRSEVQISMNLLATAQIVNSSETTTTTVN
jgi:hypothetical protein